VVVKVIVGCAGFNVAAFAGEVVKRKLTDLKHLELLADNVEFGCTSCRVLMDQNEILADADCVSDLYRQTFDQPMFNPRWECGLPGCYLQIDISESVGEREWLKAWGQPYDPRITESDDAEDHQEDEDRPEDPA
jgi:hypothetical protein